ncbi:hypothetical protein ACLOJK_041295 [Asimina triloba]
MAAAQATGTPDSWQARSLSSVLTGFTGPPAIHALQQFTGRDLTHPSSSCAASALALQPPRSGTHGSIRPSGKRASGSSIQSLLLATPEA